VPGLRTEILRFTGTTATNSGVCMLCVSSSLVLDLNYAGETRTFVQLRRVQRKYGNFAAAILQSFSYREGTFAETERLLERLDNRTNTCADGRVSSFEFRMEKSSPVTAELRAKSIVRLSGLERPPGDLARSTAPCTGQKGPVLWQQRHWTHRQSQVGATGVALSNCRLAMR